MNQNQPTYYEILDVEHDSSNETINKAFKIKAMKFHPDKNGDDVEAKRLFQLINKAKDVLLDPFRRLEHDYATGIKQRPIPPPRPNKTTNAKTLVGVGVAALIIGLFIGSSNNN